MSGWLKSSQERSLTRSVSVGVSAQGFPTILVPGKVNCAICGNQHPRKPCGFMEEIFIFQDSTLFLFPCRSKPGRKESPLLFTLILDLIYVRSDDYLKAAKNCGCLSDCEALAAPSEEESRKNYFTYLMGRCLCTPPYPIY
jgi:hypothetical protein